MDKKLNLFTPVGKVGYGVAGYNIFRILIERDWDVCLFTHGPPTERAGNQQEINIITAAVNRGRMFHYDAPCINIWHQHDLSHKIGNGPYIAFPFFELDTFDETEKHHLGFPDKICVASEWAKHIVLENGISRAEDIYVVPLGVDNRIFNPTYSVTTDSSPTVFLNCGKWEIRKGHDFIIDLFHTAFREDDNVELWMLPFNPFLDGGDQNNWENMYLDTTMGKAGKIKIFGWQDNHIDVAKIMYRASCGLFPSRAEGWNLELLEMMAIGKPVIVTNYSAHTEFCSEHNSLLIDIDKLVPAYDGKWFFEQGNWADIDVPQLRQACEYMRQVHAKVQSDEECINTGGIETGRKFSWDNTVDKIEKMLLDISA